MRKVVAIFFVFSMNYLSAQSNVATKNIQNLFDPNFRNITFLGMDFSMIKLIGDFTEALGVGTDANDQTKNAYFKSWNNLVSGERDKYDIKKMVNNKSITADIENVMKMNNATKVDDLTGYKEPNYSTQAIAEHAKLYNTATNKGLGVVLLMECFNRNDNKATIQLLVVDLATKEIVMIKKLETNPRGSGLRNYWAGSIYEAFKEAEKNFVKVWKTEYNWN